MSTENAQVTPLPQIKLERVEIQFCRKRPNSKFQVDLSIDDIFFSQRFLEREDICFKTETSCPQHTTVVVKIRRRWFLFSWIFTELRKSLETIDNEIISYRDAKQNVEVKLTFSGLLNSRKLDISLPQHQEVKADLDVARDIIDNSQLIFDKLGYARDVIKTILTAGKTFADLHPAASVASSALDWLIKTCETQEKCRDATKDFIEELDAFLSIYNEAPGLRDRQLSKDALATMLHLIARTSNYIRENTGKETTVGFLSNEYQSRINEYKDEFKKAKQRFVDNIQADTFQVVMSEANDRTLMRLDPVLKAYYNPDECCLEGTRIELIESLGLWCHGTATSIIDSTTSIIDSPLDLHVSSKSTADILTRNFVWLYGPPGIGKTTIANTIARIARQQGLYLVCFFCTRLDASGVAPDRVLSTMAYQLACILPSYRRAVLSLFDRPYELHEVLRGVLSSQLRFLFTEVFEKIAEPALPLIVIIDALDECHCQKTKLVKSLVELVRTTPWVKVLITSGYDEEIETCLDEAAELCHKLDLNAAESTEEDIRKYTEAKVEELGLSPDLVDALTEKTQGLFAWTSTVFKQLEAQPNSASNIESLFKADGEDSPPMEHLYDWVLSSVQRASNQETIRAVLGIIYATTSTAPLTVPAISKFLQCESQFADETCESVREALKSLNAVLHEDMTDGGLVRVRHASFLDFLSKKNEFLDTGPLTHKLLFNGCFRIMAQELKFNICNLEDASVFDKDVPDLQQRILRYISPELRYSCQFWLVHLHQAKLDVLDDETQAILALFFGQVTSIFWLEVMNLLGLLHRALHILQEFTRLYEEYPSLSQPCNELCNMLTAYAGALASTPHLYISALSWLPLSSSLRSILRERFSHGSLVLVRPPLETWDDLRPQATVQSAFPQNLFLSPPISLNNSGSDERFLVYSRRAVGNGATGNDGHTDAVYAVTFSPDGLQIISGGKDKSARIWDSYTGVPLPFRLGDPFAQSNARATAGLVLSTAFSPDGTHIAVGTGDWTVHIWDVATGAGSYMVLNAWVNSVSFSRDGERVLAALSDGTIREISTKTGLSTGRLLSRSWHNHGALENQYREYQQDFVHTPDHDIEQHEHHIAVYASDDTLIYSCAVNNVDDGSDSVSHAILCTWDASTFAHTGCYALHGHAARITVLTLSPRLVVCGYEDGLACVWDISSGSPNPNSVILHGCRSAVTAVTVSSCGTRVAAGARDGFVCVWDLDSDAQLSSVLVSRVLAHADWVRALAFAPNGRRVVSGGDDARIVALNVDPARESWCRSGDSPYHYKELEMEDGWIRRRVLKTNTGMNGSVDGVGNAYSNDTDKRDDDNDYDGGPEPPQPELLFWVPEPFRSSISQSIELEIGRSIIADLDSMVSRTSVARIDTDLLHRFAAREWMHCRREE